MKIFATALAAAVLSSVNAGSLRAGQDMTLVSKHHETARYLAAMSAPPTCVPENGYDYVGNDIGNAPGAAADCCSTCITTDGCKAYSWSDLNGGTCWMKSGRGTVVVNANVKSGMVIHPNPFESSPCLTLEQNTDYVGYDIGSAAAAKPEDCCSECSKVVGCHAFTHTTFNGGTCWLKSQKGRMVYKSGASSSVNYGVTQYATCGIESGVDYVGNDIGSAPASKREDCCAKCQAFTGCRAFSWTSQSGGTCYFKNRKDATVANAGVSSAAVFPNPIAPSCAMELGTDYVGNDIGNAASADSYGCCSICMKTSGCKAFSWTNQNGGTCWLKSAKGATVANANVQSAVV
ncbi:hypothetical protein Gpo141_00014692, partial [Globisporangium polare]